MNKALNTLGMAVFAIALMTGTTVAAVVPSFEWAQLEGEAIAQKIGKDQKVLVAIGGDDLTKAGDVAKSLSFGLENAGIEVLVREDRKIPKARYFVQGLVKERGEDEKPLAALRVRDLSDRTTDGKGLLVYESEGVYAPDFSSKLNFWLICAALAIVGLIIWRIGVARLAKDEANDESASTDNPFTLLSDLQAPLKTLAEELVGLDEDATCARVDELLETYVLPFAEVRRKVIDRLGMGKGSEILVVVAYGERMLNRTWSAASDGHLPEARAVFPEAVDAFTEAARLASDA